MNEKTRLLISLGASMAANCVPCFRHYHNKAIEAGLGGEEIEEAVHIAGKIKAGAQITIKNSIHEITGKKKTEKANFKSKSGTSCCG